MSQKFLSNVVIKGKIKVLTGLHIGGSKEKLEIGGVDSPVLRDPFTNFPYIPGSSLKGKMRMMLEFALGKVQGKGEVHSSNDPLDEICRIFGTSEKNVLNGPTRLTVRDAYPDEDTIEMWKQMDSELLYTEFKSENSINRLTSEANPRFTERVVKGSKFNFELVYGIYDIDDNGQTDRQYLKRVFEALRLIEHSALGGSVSRGYGQVKFVLAKPQIVTQNDYVEGNSNYKEAAKSISNSDCTYELDSPEIQNFGV